MRPFIYTERNGIHIIDLQQTVRCLEDAMTWVRDLAASNRKVLFVGTKKQAQDAIREEATRADMPYVNQRWLGGMLTNFQTIQARIHRLDDLEQRRDTGGFERLPKKEVIKLEEQIERLNKLLGGIRKLGRLPDAVFIVDPQREHIVVAEALRLGVPIIAMVDTNCDPTVVDYPIPANDDAIRAIRLVTSRMADAAIEGHQLREAASIKTTDDEAGREEAEELAAVAAEVNAVAEAAFLPADEVQPADGQQPAAEPQPATATPTSGTPTSAAE